MQDRLVALRERLQAAHLDAIVVTHPSNRFYLTGYNSHDHPPNESAGHVVVSPERAIIVASTTNSEQARQQAPGFEVFDRNRNLAEADVELLRQIDARRVGIEEQAILHRDYETLREGLGSGAELVGVGSMLEEMRAVKTAEEIATIAHAIEVTDQAFTQVASQIQAGDTERQVAWRLETAMRDLGAEGSAFSTIVAAGTNAAMPHHKPTNRPIRPGEPIVIDMGALVDGYCADLTRTVWVGEPDDMLRKVYPVVLRALQTAEAGLKPGLGGKEGDSLARDVISGAGYGEAFGHGLGHGVGVRIHEAPGFSQRSESVLAPGNVVTIEPGIYLPEWGGVRIEDVAVIEPGGARILTRAPKLAID